MRNARIHLPRRSFRRFAALGCAWLAVTGCASVGGGGGERGFTVLAINDVYRLEGVDEGTVGGLARVRALRAELAAAGEEVLFLHAGDFLNPSLLSATYDGAQMIDVMNLLDGDGAAFDERMWVTFGNHEFDDDDLEDAALLDRLIEGSQFRWLGSDLEFVRGEDGLPVVAADNLLRRARFELGGVRVGMFSLTTDAKHPAYVASFADPLTTARRMSAELRADGAEVVIGLTHLAAEDDVALMTALGPAGPDLILGGHDHAAFQNRIGPRMVLKAHAEAATATIARVTVKKGRRVEVTAELPRRLADGDPAPDPRVAARVEQWLRRHDADYCTNQLGLASGCLATVLGRTRVRLDGEELDIRRFETNLGNWLVDLARRALAPQGAQIAFYNAGSLRLNQDVPPGEITLRHVEELFPYSTELRLLRIDGATLQKVVDHAVSGWTGSGHWLQISGFAFRHDPKTGTADRLTLLAAEGPRPIRPDDELLVVTNSYLVDPGSDQDGYDMLGPEQQVEIAGEAPRLEDLAREAFRRSLETALAPQVEGRICNSERPGPCLAPAAEE